MKNQIISPHQQKGEQYHNIFRPRLLKNFIGQEQIKKNLKVFIQSSQKRSSPLDHVLISGPPGLGKTTIAQIIANEMNAKILQTSGPAIEKQGDLAAILTSLEPMQILFIDEIHRLRKIIEEMLYPAMEDNHLDIMVGQGAGAHSVKLRIPPFTLIAATTRKGLLSSPLRDRFGIPIHMDFYTHKDLEEIIHNSAQTLKTHIDKDACIEISKRSRGTPRIANRLLKRVYDFAIVETQGIITQNIVQYALTQLGVDEIGLDELDRKILKIINNDYNGGPVGISTIAASLSEEEDTIEEFCEPFLLMMGFIKRSSQGRVLTDKGKKYITQS